jgi:carbonic anhydrase
MKLLLRVVLGGVVAAGMAALATLTAVKWLQASASHAEAEKLLEIVQAQRERVRRLEADVKALEATARTREERLKSLEKAAGGLAVASGADSQQLCQLARETALIEQPSKPGTRPPALEVRYRPGPLRVAHMGSSVRLIPAPGGMLKIDADAVELISVDLHVPSSGIFAGTAAALVAQFVHRGADGRPVVISVPLRESAFQQRTLWTVAQHVPAVGAAPVDVPAVSLDPASLLPDNMGYDLFAGALPVQPCVPGARFYRLRSPVGLSREQIDKWRGLLAPAAVAMPRTAASAVVPASAPPIERQAGAARR